MTLTVQNEKQPGIVRYDTLHGEVALTVDYVVKYFCPKASREEAFAFMQLCRFHRLNPFLREAYLIKYGGDAAQFVIGYQAWTQRAEQDPRYKGFKAGLIFAKPDGTLDRREGTFYQNSETLVGGWCEVYLEHRSDPVIIELALHEYIQHTRDGGPNRFWKEKPGTMIRKCAIAQAHREGFPSLFGGLYDQAEVGPDVDLPEDAIVIEGMASPLAVPTTETRPNPLPPDRATEGRQSDAGVNDEGTTAESTPATNDIEGLRDAIAEAGMSWDEFELAVLRCTWQTFTGKNKGTVEVALNKLRTYQEEQAK